MPLSGHRKILHTLVGMGSADLAAAVLYPSKVTLKSHEGQKSTLKKGEKNRKKHTQHALSHTEYCGVPPLCLP